VLLEMQLRNPLLLSLLAGSLHEAGAVSQGSTPCVDPAWSSSDIQIVRDVAFGSAFNFVTGKNETLLLDAYMPPAGDSRKTRPAAVLVHGGSFETGNKESDDEPELALNLAARGWVVVSINYRLEGYPMPAGLLNDVAPIAAVEDVRAAIRFVRKNAAEYRLDVDRVLVAGDSAGAIASLYLGYVETAQHEGHSGNPGFRSDVQLAIPVSGQLVTQAFCRTVVPKPTDCKVQNLTNNHNNEVGARPGQPALLMVHGTNDLTVPYANAKAVFDRAQATGLKSKLIAIPGARHVPFRELFHTGTYFKDFMSFVVDALKLSADECPTPMETSVVV